MHFKLSKKLVFLSLALLLVTLLAVGAFVLFANKQNEVDCPKARRFFTKSSCGLLVSSEDRSSHSVSAIVSNKQEKDGNYLLTILTKDGDGKVIEERVSLPPSNRSAGLSTKFQDRADENISVKPEELFSKIDVGSEVVLFVLTPDQQTIRKVKQQFGESRFVECYNYNHLFISRLKKPQTSSGGIKLSEELAQNCPVSVSQVLIYREKY